MSDPIEKEGEDTLEQSNEPVEASKAVHESIAEAVIKIMPEAEKVAGEVLILAMLVESAVKSHLSSHAQNQSELTVKNELAAKLNPVKI